MAATEKKPLRINKRPRDDDSDDEKDITEVNLEQTILVAAATANTGGALVRHLSALQNGPNIVAAVRSQKDARAVALAALPRVSLVTMDFDDLSTVTAALKGVDRAFLVSAPFDHLQFERETDFLELAGNRDKPIPVVRVGTASGLYSASSKAMYARAHHGIEHYAQKKGYPTITLRPNWFFDNLLFGAQEIKAAGQITYPSAGQGPGAAFVDPRDVASAAATILLLSDDKLSKFVEARSIEVHGPALLNLAQNVKILGDAVGYPIKIVEAPLNAWVDAMVGFGMLRVAARSFGATVMKIDGTLPADAPMPQKSSPLLLKAGWAPKYNVKAWAASDKVQSALKVETQESEEKDTDKASEQKEKISYEEYEEIPSALRSPEAVLQHLPLAKFKAAPWSRTPCVLLSCGSFSPPTYLHLRILEEAKNSLEADGEFEVIGAMLSPVHDDYGKHYKHSLQAATAEHRIAMAKLATASSSWIGVSDFETTVDMWTRVAVVLDTYGRALDAHFGQKVHLKFVGGSDLLKGMRKPGLWRKDHQELILGKYGFVAIERAGDPLDEEFFEFEMFKKHRKNIHSVVLSAENTISSTKVRQLLTRTKSVKYMLPDSVVEYIEEHKLYSSS